MKLFLVFLATQAVFAAEDLLGLPLPCKATTTITAGKYTSRVVTTVTKVKNRVKTVTKKGATLTSTVRTTITTPTKVHCLARATTFTASPLPITTAKHHQDETLHDQVDEAVKRDKQTNEPWHKHPHRHRKCPSPSTVTVYQPLLPGLPCTRFIRGTTVTATKTDTETRTHVHTSTVSEARSTTTVTQTFVMPSPSTFRGVNYYQYLNNYSYHDSSSPSGISTAGFGGGGYETSDWRGNFSYYTRGITRDINFESENYPSYSTIYCQLPGQSAPSYCATWTVVFQGFLYAREAGNYTATFQTPLDDEIIAWGGEKAYRDYHNDNCDWFLGDSEKDGKPHSFTYVLNKGEFLPMTFIYSNGEGPGINNVLITSPDGTTYPTDLDLFVPPCPHSPFIP